ncbi:MAG: HAD hydrolase-like protein [Pseudomonadota bacterium]
MSIITPTTLQNNRSILVFDIDGTLTDSIAPHQEALEAALRSFNFPTLRTDWASYKHHSDSAIFVEAWKEANFKNMPDKLRFEAEYKVRFDHACKQSPLKEIVGASKFLASLTDSPWHVVYATGSLRYGAQKKLESIGTEFSNDLLVTASEYETREEIVSQAIIAAQKKYNLLKPSRIVSVGDGLWDFKTAKTLGLEFLGIGHGQKAEALRSLGAVVFNDFSDLNTLHAALNG